MDVPLTQSKSWQNLQEDLGEISYYQKGNGYHYLAIHKFTPVGSYLYLPYGPVAKDLNSFRNALKELNSIAQKKHALFIRIEPQNPEFTNHLSSNTKEIKEISPKDTWKLNLNQSREEIVLGFSHGIRNSYNTFRKKGLVVEKTTDIEQIKHLTILQDKLFKKRNLNTFSEKYLQTELKQPFATLYLVKYYHPEGIDQTDHTPKDGQVLAASLFFDYHKTRYYMQSASDETYKKLPATVALLTTAIFDAKDKGLQIFDFWGIAPDGAPKDHPWAGFTKFKKMFGGEPVHYAGTYDIVLKPFKYRLYQLIRIIHQFFRHHKI